MTLNTIMEEKMTNKRKIAVGLASLVFILSFIIPSTVKLLAPQDDSEETTSFFQELMNGVIIC